MEKFKHLYNFGDIVKIQITKKTIRVGVIVGMVFSGVVFSNSDDNDASVIYQCHSYDKESVEIPFYFKDVDENKIIEKLGSIIE
jgi:hypothetical protein